MQYGSLILATEKPMHPRRPVAQCSRERLHRNAVFDEFPACECQFKSVLARDVALAWASSQSLRAGVVELADLSDLCCGPRAASVRRRRMT